ncbi:hypothetical protein [Burkholderia sp. BCC1998]|uniref:hypothetical protein n=1 Tax=Burkholderia sp. BCC1998 TaxID=2817447 RepID=UPI002AB67E26|nr:hypothetical protein [Burkholderia sp. BCC1998]
MSTGNWRKRIRHGGTGSCASRTLVLVLVLAKTGGAAGARRDAEPFSGGTFTARHGFNTPVRTVEQDCRWRVTAGSGVEDQRRHLETMT